MGLILSKVVYGVSAPLRMFAYLEKSLLFRASAPKPRKPRGKAKARIAKAEAILESAIAPPVAPLAAAAAPAPVSNLVVMAAPAAPTFVPTAPELPAPVIKPRTEPAPVGAFPVATYKLVPSAESPVYSFASHAHAAATPAGSHGFDSASGDEYEDFIAHMKSGKRPFRKPGISIKEEFELWHAARTKAHAHAGSHHSGLGRLLQVGRNLD
jgi:hypothetical protein